MKKRIFILSAVILLCTVLWGAFFAVKCRNFTPVVPAETTVDNSTPAVTGGTVLCKTDITLPWFSRIEVRSVNIDKCAVVSGTPDVTVSDYGLFLRTNSVAIKLCAVEPGTVDGASVVLAIKTPGKHIAEYTCVIPRIQIAEPSGKTIPVLQLAEKETLPQEKNFWKYAVAVAAVLVAGALVLGAVWYFKFRRTSRQLSEWEKAKRDLELLRSDIEEKRITAAHGFIRLTDLVRGYLEKRFGLPATRRTTQEFLENLSGTSSGKLPAESKPFLKSFLQAADQVKFARASADTSLLEKAVEDASMLIDSTCPAEEEKQNV